MFTKKALEALAVMATFGLCALLGGCEKEVSHEKKTTVDNGEVKTKETTVKETPEGNIIIEEKKTEKDYKSGETKSESETKEYTPPKN